MKSFCNKEMKYNRYLPGDKASDYRNRFTHCVDLCRTVFGENAFRRFKPGDNADPNGGWVASRINLALFDVQMGGFVNYEKSRIVPHSDEIREAMIALNSYDDEFITAIESQTSSRKMMEVRFEKWLGKLKEIVSGPPQPRNFSYEVKSQLFQADPTCKLCGNQILMIEDAEVDHIIPFSQGGSTTLENAQIAHRYCNRHKSDKT